MRKRMTIARRIASRRKALDLTQEQLATLMGVAQTTIAAWETGRNIPKTPSVKKLSAILGVPASWLRDGDEPSVSRQVRKRGYLGAGERVIMFPDEHVPEWVAAPPDEKIKTEAFEVRGNSMYPVYRDGDLVYFEAERLSSPSDHVGDECIVELTDGAIYIKQIIRGSEANTFTLSSYNAPPMLDQVIVSCAPVLWIKRNRKHR